MDALERRVKALEDIIASLAPGTPLPGTPLPGTLLPGNTAGAGQTLREGAARSQVADRATSGEVSDIDRLVVDRIKHLLGIPSDAAAAAAAPQDSTGKYACLRIPQENPGVAGRPLFYGRQVMRSL